MRCGILGILLLAASALTAPLRAADPGFGLGIIVGEPTGISMKAWLTRLTAIDAAAAWSFVDRDAFQIHLDYLMHNENVLRTDELSGRLLLYYGIGGRFKFLEDRPRDGDPKDEPWDDDDDAIIGVRIPVGITYLFRTSPFDLFVEIVPTLDLAPETDFDLDAAIGGRFYFR